MGIRTSGLLFDDRLQKVLWCHVDLPIELDRGELDEAPLARCKLNGLVRDFILQEMEKSK